MNAQETKALCDAFSFLSMTHMDYRPEHSDIAIREARKHKEVLRDLINDDVAKHFENLCYIAMEDATVHYKEDDLNFFDRLK